MSQTTPSPPPETSPTAPKAAVASGPNFCLVFIDLTTGATPQNLKPGPVMQSIIDACLEQVNGPFADAYGRLAIAMRIGSGPADRGPSEIAVNFRDSIPEAPEALAYHTVTMGIPDIEIGCDLFTSTTSGSESISGGVSHEILEMLRDAGANGWKSKNDGSSTMSAEEACDPVQNTGYSASNGVWVTNFVLPSYWVPGSSGPYDLLGKLTAVTNAEIALYGYEIQATDVTETTQVGGEKALLAHPRHHQGRAVYAVGQLSELQKKRKSHPFARSRRRGLDLTPSAEAPTTTP
jgi:hypothetical protein